MIRIGWLRPATRTRRHESLDEGAVEHVFEASPVSLLTCQVHWGQVDNLTKERRDIRSKRTETKLSRIKH